MSHGRSATAHKMFHNYLSNNRTYNFYFNPSPDFWCFSPINTELHFNTIKYAHIIQFA